MRPFFIILLLFISFCPAYTQTARQTISIIHLDHKPIIKATLNEQTAMFLIDSGSDITVLNSSDADNFGFIASDHKNSTNRLKSIDNEVIKLLHARNVELKLGKTIIRKKFYAMNLDKLAASIKKDTDIIINGIIGSDLMRMYGFKIDYVHKQIQLALK